ncbi:MAG: hypothetical protein JRJ60_08335 [Deltaproteobacteria bacterium]|nr:hypothetical protein [Deltaproteobacteria bacterium]
MPLTLRQICLVAKDLEPAIDDLTSVLGIEACYADPDVVVFGLKNTLLAVGTNFIEVVSPIEEGTAAGRYLKRRNGDGGYMIITQTDGRETQEACRIRAASMDIRVAWELPHDTGRYMQLHPADTGGSFFEIDWDENNDPVGNWPPAGGSGWEKFVKTDVVSAIVAAELQSPDPTALARRWSAVTDIPLGRDLEDRPVINLENATIRFVEDGDGRGEGLGGIDILATDPERLLKAADAGGFRTSEMQVVICGLRFNII